LLFVVLSAACVDVTPTPAWEARNVAGYVKTATGLPPDESLAWHLEVVGDIASWRECSAVDVCTTVERRRPASDLLSFSPVGHATVEGEQVDVVRLSLSPRPAYVVPTRP
jgi:hypothetical protein